MLVTASRTSPRAKVLHARRLARSGLSVPSALVVLGPRQIQSRRGLRYCHWSYGEHDASRETRKRYRAARYRYMESIHRRAPWSHHGRPDHNASVALREALAQLASWPRPHAAPSYADADAVKSWSDDISGVRPGRNIEDVERDAIDHLFRPVTSPSEYDTWKTPFQNIRNYLRGQRAPNDLAATPKYEDLDQYGPVEDVKPSPKRSRKPPADKGKYGPVRWNEPDGLQKQSAEEASKNYSDLAKYKPVQWNEPDGLPGKTLEEDSKQYPDLHRYSPQKHDNPNQPRKLTPEEESKAYNDLDKYKPVEWQEPNGLPNMTAEEQSKEYEDLGKYGPVRWQEPDGLPKPTAEEQSKEYEDLDRYGPVRWHEPDGFPEPTAEEQSKEYEDLTKYGPVRWHEPDGFPEPTPEEQSKEYEDLHTYQKPFLAKDALLQEQEANLMDATPKAEPIAAKVEVATEDPCKQYDDLDKYGPVRWNEPDGLRKLTPEEESKDYEDLHMYGAVRWSEPDGLRKLTPEEKSKSYKDLHKYAPTGPTGPEMIPERIHPEEASKEYEDLPRYTQYTNGDAAPRVHPEEASKAYKDLNKYTQYTNGDTAPRVHPEVASKEYNDLHKYTQYTNGDSAPPVHPEVASKEYEDLHLYSSYPNKGPAEERVHPEQATKAYKDLHAYTPVMHNEPDGQRAEAPVISSGLEVYDTAEQQEFDESTTAEQIRANVLRKAHDNSQKLKVDEAEAAPQGRAPETRKLTGNFLRDFPEEFSKRWSTTYAPSRAALFSNDQAETADAEISSMDESFPQEETKLEPSLHRQAFRSFRSKLTHLEKMLLMDDPYSTIPMGLETSYEEECGGKATWPTLVKHYAKTFREPESVADEQPMLYKILAYDPTSQSVNSAETTSAVHDASSPSTPADVLTRLSHPSKFLQHFAPMQADGYEIISGSGDVLVFRKVRSGTGKPVVGATTARIPAINPIDMMGKVPVTGNFASPTGFVNYGAIAEEGSAKPAPPFRSNIDVRKEEPVFSGGRSSQEEGTRKPKKSFGRRVVMTTVWVAGAAYAVGVLSEYFSTGGLSGLGPTGL